ncbi:DUF3293 domain-containing protein [Frankia sp. CNm7]|uniref:DUF3293 domain-containing protein n=1 Tax=Frankia nepalensis TaxID=1836974 RepID=A0A937URK0_9ACTN|nr:DUF3293 domain-containing protein [Frankia nepalensis]MBL7501832.1 DUF3293 domain-containing protein [Frankia nepalensis]MBL7514088.1 DUF3293 domain-containing protein [Frankia nepalensis]MBL7522874.1 DUF3293 domain-containing protein [Frankia nepalensis]MBL7632939.1 DUF3293 domain-containing protein [Frankia nepalensis]
MPTPANPSRTELLAILGATPGASATAACRSYLEHRRKLLAADPDPRRAEVRRLDEAFGRLRAADGVARRLADYQRARVRIGVGAATVTVSPAEPGTTAGDFPFPGVDRVHVLTAFNPRSRRLRPHENAGRQRSLAGQVAATGLPSWPAVGGAGGHAEPGIAVAGLSRARARALGAEFEQDAIFEWTRTAWSLVPCDELVEPRELGWESVRVETALPDPLRAPATAAQADRTRAEAEEEAAIARARARAAEPANAEAAAPGEPPPVPEPGQAAGTTPEPGPAPTGLAGEIAPAPRDLPASRGGAGE